MGPVRQRVNEMLETFSGLDDGQKLLLIYTELLEERFSLQLDNEEYESPEYTGEDLEYEQSAQLQERIAELHFTYRELLFVLKSTGILNELSRQFVSNSQISKVLAILMQKSAKKLEQDLNSSQTAQAFCLEGEQEIEFLEKMAVLRSNGLPKEVVQHFVRWNRAIKAESRSDGAEKS
jgi:hypothetical protein